MKYMELDKVVLQILDVEVGHSFNKIYENQEKFLQREKEEIKKQIEKTGKIDYSQWSTVCFDKIYKAVETYKENNFLPSEDLIKVASNIVMKNTEITNERVARSYVIDIHNEYVNKLFAKLNDFKQSGEAIAMQTGKSYFEDRNREIISDKINLCK